MRRRGRRKMLTRQRHDHHLTWWLVTVGAAKAAEIVQKPKTLQGHLFDGQTADAAVPRGHRGGGWQHCRTAAGRSGHQERIPAL
jgi:hypothetical protein